MSWFSPRLVLEGKCVWQIHPIKVVLTDENWRRNKMSASLAKLLLLLLDCFMEDMNLIHFQSQLGNSRQQRKGLPLDLAVFSLKALHLSRMQSVPLLKSFLGEGQCMGTDPLCLSLSDLGTAVPWNTSTGTGELAAPAGGTPVKKENSL